MAVKKQRKDYISQELDYFEKKLKQISDYLINTKFIEDNYKVQIDIMEKLPAMYEKLAELRKDDEVKNNSARGGIELSELDKGEI